MLGRAVLSDRTALDPTPNRIARALEEARRAGRPLLDLTSGNPTVVGLPYTAAEIGEALADPRALRYEPAPFGLPEARAAVASLHGVPPDRVALTASTSEAYSFLFKVLCDPGDTVLVPQPSYPLLEMLARFEGVELRPYRLAYDGEWHVDVASLRAAAGPRTRAVIAVSPNNPTGSYLKREELEAMLDAGPPIICDEVFAGYPLRPDDGSRVTTVAACTRGLAFSLGGLSKQAGLPQMKLGWIVAAGEPARIDEAMQRLELVADAFLSAGTPVMVALPALLHASAVTRDAIAERCREGLATLARALRGSAASVLHAEGGWYAVVRLPAVQSEEQWVLDLLTREVVVQPGYFFDFEREAFVVISLLTPSDVMEEGARRLRDAVDGEAGPDHAARRAR